jgi:hypothetical protein
MTNKRTDDNDPFDEHGLLKDGRRVRISQMMRDSALRQDRGRKIGLPEHQWEEEEDDDDDVHDGQRVRDASNTPLGLHRPGFRRLIDAADHAALTAAKAKAYAAYDAEASRAYLTPEFGGSDPARTGSGSKGPRQEPPLGSPCTRNGFPGTWARNAAGQMYCDIRASAGRADAKARLRSRLDPDADDDEDNSRSVAQAASDHQQRMARIYDALDQELREAWRTP